MKTRLFLLLLLGAPAALAQFELDLPGGGAVPPLYNFGQAETAQAIAVRFRLRNLSTAPATLSTLTLAGVGFTLDAPPVPIAVAAQDAVDLTVTFAASGPGSYSAALHINGVVTLLTATVVPSLTYLADSGASLIPVTSLDFGAIQRGLSIQRRVTVRNDSGVFLTIPAITLNGPAFSLSAAIPAGQLLQPQQSAVFSVAFSPIVPGAYTGTLNIGSRSFPLTATATEPPLPTPSLTIAPKGTLLITYDAPAETAGTGTASLTGPSDPTIVFANGSRTAAFSVAPGDTQATLLFQTGTTAGTFTITVTLGGATARQSFTIAPAPVAVTASQAIRVPGSIELRLTGYDNTRTLAPLTFTFLDAAGKILAALHTDASADFAGYFASSNLGGVFLLRATFPVTGDASAVAACDVTLGNAIGTPTQHIPIP